MAAVTAGRFCFTITALASSLGSFASDWSTTHLFNPRWPPHAKFHNGQTLSMGVCLALGVLYFTWVKPTYATSIKEEEDCTTMAAVFGSLYWLTGLSAWFYPNSAGIDPEFGKGFPQLPFFSAWWGICGLGYVLEMRRLAGLQ